MDETFIRKSKNLCKSIVVMSALDILFVSASADCSYKRWEFESKTNRFTLRQNKSRYFERMFFSYFKTSRTDCRLESYVTFGWQLKIGCFSVDRFCIHCYTVFEAMRCFYHYCLCQEAHLYTTDAEIERRVEDLLQNEMRRVYISQKGYPMVAM